MATIDLATKPGDGSHTSVFDFKKVYTISNEIDLAAAATLKGTALAVGDIIQALDLPKYCTVLRGGVTITSAMTGSSTDATIDVGVTAVDPDGYVDGLDLDASAIGTVSQSGVQTAVSSGLTQTTVDVLIATQTGTITGGKILVWAVVGDVSGIAKPGLVQLKS